MTAPALISRAAAAKMLSIGISTLKRYDAAGTGPGFVRVGPKMVRYSPDACRAWAEAQAFPHRAAEVARRSLTKQKAPEAG